MTALPSFVIACGGDFFPVPKAALIDVDGTLVDTNYHHALCWSRAFLDHDVVVPLWRLHRHIGMGGDKYITAVAGERVEQALGDVLRDRWEELFDEVIREVRPVAGALQVVQRLKARGCIVVIASSSIERHLKAHIARLEIGELIDGYTTSDDVANSKPSADLIEAALAKAGTRDAVMIGDSPWDIIAARRAGVGTLAVLTGGFAPSELHGATAIFDSVAELRVD